MEREPWYFPPRSDLNDRRRVLRFQEFKLHECPFMVYRQNVRYHPDDSGYFAWVHPRCLEAAGEKHAPDRLDQSGKVCVLLGSHDCA